MVKTMGEGEKLVPDQTGRQPAVDLDLRTLDAFRRLRVARAGLDLRLVRDNSLIFSDLNGGYLNPGQILPTIHPIADVER